MTARRLRWELPGDPFDHTTAAPSPLPKRRLRIDWVVTELVIGSGGHRSILRAAYYLEKFGHDVGLYFINIDLDDDQIRDRITAHFYPFEGRVKRFDGSFREADAIFATHWSTVEVTLRARPQVKHLMYYVQDYEPYFDPMGANYVLSENTYRLGLHCVCFGPWCAHILKERFDASVAWHPFPLNRHVYFTRPRKKENQNLVFFAKPEMPRRCYPLGLMVLRRLHERMPDLEIILYGSDHVNEAELGFPATVRAIVPTIEDLAQMYCDADLGMAFSTTNPSLVPYEMMACGLPIVDIRRPGNEVNYGGRFDVALLADPLPDRMADQIVQLLSDPVERNMRSQRGLELVSQMPSEEQMVRTMEMLIAARV